MVSKMIITGQYDRTLKDTRNAILSFVIPSYQADLNLEQGKDYKIEITEMKSKRSLWQNKYMWAIIDKIAKHEGMLELDVYCQIIEMAKIRTEFIETIPEAIARLSSVFRVVKELEQRESKKGNKTVLVKCYYGTSTFDTKEMSDFIDVLLDYASQIGIDVSEYQV